ncbi:MAG: hypothetical protein IPG72_16155 [Ardenticatenales bacterium]|nr:hypothetical protein [Ardenticatenales bacterium]
MTTLDGRAEARNLIAALRSIGVRFTVDLDTRKCSVVAPDGALTPDHWSELKRLSAAVRAELCAEVDDVATILRAAGLPSSVKATVHPNAARDVTRPVAYDLDRWLATEAPPPDPWTCGCGIERADRACWYCGEERGRRPSDHGTAPDARHDEPSGQESK